MILNSIATLCQEFEQTLPYGMIERRDSVATTSYAIYHMSSIRVARNETHDRKDDVLW